MKLIKLDDSVVVNADLVVMVTTDQTGGVIVQLSTGAILKMPAVYQGPVGVSAIVARIEEAADGQPRVLGRPQ